MPYVPPNGSAVELDLAGDYRAPAGASINLEFDPATTADVRQATVAASGAVVGSPQVVGTPLARARGFSASAFGRVSVGTDTPKIAPAGIDSTITVGTPEYVRWPKYADPASINPPIWPLGTLRVRLMGGYSPPPADSLVLNWFAEPYAPPPASSLQLDFGALGYGYVLPAMGDVSAFGSPTVAMPVGLRPAGIAAPALGVPRIQTSTNELRVSGFNAAAFGVAYLQNKGVALKPGGIAPGAFGTSYIWNLLQFLGAKGFDGLKVGEAFVSGGIKIVTPNGLDAPALGKPLVVNTTADQTARPQGIAAPAVPGPNVSPRTVFPFGILGSAFGTPFVQRNPAPKGFDASLYGVPFIEFKTKYLTPDGIDAGAFGFPRAFDPTRKLFPSSVIQAGVFGDTRIANRSFVVRVPGSDYLAIPAWHYVENNRRHLAAPGWNSAAYGTLLIANKSPSIAPPGIDSLRIGSAAIGYSVRYITPAGINSMRLGAPSLTKTPEIAPKGFAGAMGAPTVWRRVRSLEVLGRDSQVFGGLTIWFRYRYLPMQGFAADLHGKPNVEHGRRTLLASGMQHAAYGTASVTNAERTIAPPSIFQFFASSHMVGGLRFLRPVGFDAAQFGARIIPEIQQAYPLGFAGSYGLPTIRNSTQLVAPPGFITVGQQPADRWGTVKVYNLVQYISMFYDPDSALNPPAWPQWTLIENRNRYMRATGMDMALLGIPQIDNKARPLLPVGIVAPDPAPFYKAGMVSYWLRTVRLEGMEPPYLSSWATVYNDAFVAAPGGINGQAFGQPAIENTRRVFDRIGGFESSVLGYPMVADRIRYLDIESRYGIAPPQINLPEVKLHTRYVDGRGDDLSRIGSPSLEIHFTIIAPKWTLQNLYGDPVVRNLTPELHTYGLNMEAFGDTAVRLQWRPVKPEGALTQWMGKPDIAYRDRTLFLSGFRAGAIGDKLTVVRTGAPPYSTQYIVLDAVQDSSGLGSQTPNYGIGPPLVNDSQFGKPIMNQQVLYVRQDQPNTLFGDARVTANTIRVEPGYWDLLIGEPMVSLRIRTLTVGEWGDDQVPQPAKPRLSPHTIYAVVEAPQQAKDNHPTPIGLHYVDGYYRTPGAIFGSATVMNQHRQVDVSGSNNMNSMTRYGQHSLTLRRQYVTPNGFTSFRSGWHTVPGPQEVVQYDSASFMAMGQPKVAPPPYIGPQTIKGIGLASQAFGSLLIEFFNRPIYPAGYLATLMGTRKPGDTPYMWQGLRVGPLMPTIPMGIDSQAVGTPWVSFRVLELKLEGFDAFRLEYELEAFDRRMRVWRREAERPRRTITPVGIAAFESAASDVKPGVHFIRPDGNADQYRKGAF